MKKSILFVVAILALAGTWLLLHKTPQPPALSELYLAQTSCYRHGYVMYLKHQKIAFKEYEDKVVVPGDAGVQYATAYQDFMHVNEALGLKCPMVEGQ
ncbi:hypothetical protein [Leeia aquatica]|uniref:Uncharacterized protein n=1 Tax=Leeia aquatica TaxID=2725557 RepID=A0A847SAS9_9NEIS|nr:hypothetical protein [Leeia aquatica]NLR74188.1 hypothetical protein [Leeia aquatica]